MGAIKHFLHKYRSVPIFSANITNLTHTPNFHLKLTRVIPTFNTRVSGLLAVALAVIPGVLGKSVIVYFDDNNTPDSIVDQAKKDIVSAGGKITHVYSIIKGFAADAPEEALQSVQEYSGIVDAGGYDANEIFREIPWEEVC